VDVSVFGTSAAHQGELEQTIRISLSLYYRG